MSEQNFDNVAQWYKEKDKDPEWKPEYDTNNFYCNLPGGHRRSKGATKMIETIDQLLEKFSLDGQQLFVEIEKGVGMVIEGLNLIGKDPEKAKELLEKGEKMRNDALKKIFPVYEEMVKMGFDENKMRS